MKRAPGILSRAASAIKARLPIIGPMSARIGELTSQRGWLLAQIDRLSSAVFSRTRISTVDQELSRDRSNMLRMIREICRNSPLAISAKSVVRERTIGFLGVIPTLQTDDEKLNVSIESEFRADMDSLGLLGESWYELQRIWLGEYVETGEAIAEWSIEAGEFKVSCIESEQLQNSTFQGVIPADRIFADGILYDLRCRPVSYHVTPFLPGSWGYSIRNARAGSIEIPASRICHMYAKDRPSQTRGVSPLAAVVQSINDIADTNFAEQKNIYAGACLGVMVDTSETDGGVIDDLEAETNSNADTSAPQSDPAKQVTLQPGMFQEVNGKPSMLDPSRPGDHYGPFVTMLSCHISAALRIPQASLTNDTRNASWSSEKMAHLYCAPGTDDRQRLLVQRLLRPLFRAWLEYAIISGRVTLPAQGHISQAKRKTVDRIMRSVVWQYPAQPLPEPFKEMLANQVALGLGLKSWSQLCAEQGVDPREAALQLANDDKLLAKYGLSRVSFLAQSGAAIGPAIAALNAIDNPPEDQSGSPAPTNNTNVKALR